MGMAERDNVLPFRRAHRDSDEHLDGHFVAPDDVRELVSLMSDNTGKISVVLTPSPEGVCAWELRTQAEVERFGVHVLGLAAKMNGRGGPP